MDSWFVCFDKDDKQLCPPVDVEKIEKDGSSIIVELKDVNLYNSNGWTNIRRNIWKLEQGKMSVSVWNEQGNNVYTDHYAGVDLTSVSGIKDQVLYVKIKKLFLNYSQRVREREGGTNIETRSKWRAQNL